MGRMATYDYDNGSVNRHWGPTRSVPGPHMYQECYEIILPPNFRALEVQQFNNSMRVASHVLVAGEREWAAVRVCWLEHPCLLWGNHG